MYRGAELNIFYHHSISTFHVLFLATLSIAVFEAAGSIQRQIQRPFPFSVVTDIAFTPDNTYLLQLIYPPSASRGLTTYQTLPSETWCPWPLYFIASTFYGHIDTQCVDFVNAWVTLVTGVLDEREEGGGEEERLRWRGAI
ncbi:hypothetical protein BZA77DRAFT_293975 [Pyronema omphalodes]|nr:hypothetical protein BZA77DRAFT_293975 [Pyronema omphalodes]